VAHAGETMGCPALSPFAVVDQQGGGEEKGKCDCQNYCKGGDKSHVLPCSLSAVFLCSAKIIKMDILFFHTEIFQHLKYSLVHHRRAAEIVVDIFGTGVVFQILFQGN